MSYSRLKCYLARHVLGGCCVFTSHFLRSSVHSARILVEVGSACDCCGCCNIRVGGCFDVCCLIQGCMWPGWRSTCLVHVLLFLPLSPLIFLFDRRRVVIVRPALWHFSRVQFIFVGCRRRLHCFYIEPYTYQKYIPKVYTGLVT